MINKGCAWISVTTNGNAFKNSIRGICNDVVQFVRHATRLRDVCDGARAVELGCNNVIHHTTGVANLERTRFDAANCSRANDGYTILLRNMQDLASALKRLALGLIQIEVTKLTLS